MCYTLKVLYYHNGRFADDKWFTLNHYIENIPTKSVRKLEIVEVNLLLCTI